MRQFIPWPAAPGNNATIVLFATHPRNVGQAASAAGREPSVRSLEAQKLNAIEFTWLQNDQASAPNGVRLYAIDSTDTWREVDLKNNSNLASIGSASPRQVPALSAGQEWHYLIDVSRYRGVAVEYTAGATGPTNWDGVIEAHFDVEAVLR